VPAQSVEIVGGEQFLKSLAGNQVTVTGKIELYNGNRDFLTSADCQRVGSSQSMLDAYEAILATDVTVVASRLIPLACA
jgi:hypothetical protein